MLPEDLHWRWQQAAASKRVSATEALRQAISEWAERTEIEVSKGVKAAGPVSATTILDIQDATDLKRVQTLLLALREQDEFALRILSNIDNYERNRGIRNKEAEVPPTEETKPRAVSRKTG